MMTGTTSLQIAGVSTVSVRGFRYGDGMQADNNVVSHGGFDTIFTVFDSIGNRVTQNDDGFLALTDPNTGRRSDSYLESVFPAGTYILAITQFNNSSSGLTLGDGFSQTGNPFFTAGLGGCSNGQFCDTSGMPPFDNRTNARAIDFLNVASASPVPLPAAVWLLSSGLFAFSGFRRFA